MAKLGLEQYALNFADNDIDFSLLPRLSSPDLKELGITSLGHRKKHLDAIAKLHPEESGLDGFSVVTGEAELRQLTVMFCDLAGSTSLSEKYDPEDLG